MPVSEILRWLVVGLLALAFLALLVWPRLNLTARALALAGCVCGGLMAILLSQPFLWAFCACTAAAAAIGMVGPHRRLRSEYSDPAR
jgi:hypothetical protein